MTKESKCSKQKEKMSYTLVLGVKGLVKGGLQTAWMDGCVTGKKSQSTSVLPSTMISRCCLVKALAVKYRHRRPTTPAWSLKTPCPLQEWFPSLVFPVFLLLLFLWFIYFILCLYAYLCTMYVRPEESIKSPRTGAADGCELLCRCWDLNLGPLEERSELFTAELSLWPVSVFLLLLF